MASVTPTTQSSGRTSQAGSRAKRGSNRAEEAFAYWCRALKLPMPQRNFRFHPTRRFEIDWAWPTLKVGIEIQGGIWVGGAHARPMNIVRDMTKHNLLLDFGWRVWHYTPKEVVDGIAAEHLDKVLRAADTRLGFLEEPVIPPASIIEGAEDGQKAMDF
jgi:very-short-patch-repair endonuclease